MTAFAPAFARWLATPGPPFVSPAIALDDVFVTPPLWLARADRSASPVDAVDLALKTERLLISGPQRIGRTTLAKRIVTASRARGETPVYARGDFLHARLDPTAVEARLAALVRDQYGDARRSPDVLVLDDVDRARLGGSHAHRAIGRSDVLAAVARRMARVVAFTTEHDLATRVNARGAAPYAAASIGTYDAGRRAALAARYVEAVAPVETWRAFVGPARRILDDLFGDGRLPAFPYYVLVALAELYTGDPAHIDGTHYGPYYETIVHEAARRARR
ncbi:ATP-binding protein [Rubrivirga sp. IMCC45206]|uniref:ATP-binding protein n=1 Tax=Rubrivirga sp. IMCC45206 TaxID=3391614 RepID=UPI00399005A8